MSRYIDIEICGDCQYAIFYDCGNCLKKCEVNAKKQRNFLSGYCGFLERSNLNG